MERIMTSVIIPTHNRAHVLERAVRSVLNQKGESLEVIVVDDASTDETRTLLERIGDPRIRYERLPVCSGACAARNRGVELARGDYVAFQDSDDEWLPGKLACQRRQLEESGADVVFCAFERCTAKGERLQVFPTEETAPGRVTRERLLRGNLCSTQTILGRRACFEEIRFDTAFPRLQDWELILRMAARYDVRYFSDMLVRVYEQPDSISAHPERLLDALRRLSAMYRDVIGQDDQLAALMVAWIKVAALNCGENPWRDYLRALSKGLSLRTNTTFVCKAVYLLLTGPFRRAADTPRRKETII